MITLLSRLISDKAERLNPSMSLDRPEPGQHRIFRLANSRSQFLPPCSCLVCDNKACDQSFFFFLGTYMPYCVTPQRSMHFSLWTKNHDVCRPPQMASMWSLDRSGCSPPTRSRLRYIPRRRCLHIYGSACRFHFWFRQNWLRFAIVIPSSFMGGCLPVQRSRPEPTYASSTHVGITLTGNFYIATDRGEKILHRGTLSVLRTYVLEHISALLLGDKPHGQQSLPLATLVEEGFASSYASTAYYLLLAEVLS
ncbi:hypothetical protein EDD16DRAFT_373640 [Pisolithus croceorrhizus]|nr:hypothetical protein EDD16DRAFT_373640 [Pisolithus croceorrhizus]